MEPSSRPLGHLPAGSSPNKLEFVVTDQEVEMNRLKNESLPTGGYVAFSITADHAEKAQGVFTGFQEGSVPAHTGVKLCLYLSFGYGLDLETATLQEFSRNFHYFYTIVTDPTHKRDVTGGCVILRDEPQRVKSGNATYWMPGTSRGFHDEMQPGNFLMQFDNWQDGVLTGRCLDPANPNDGSPDRGGGTCDVKVSFSVRLMPETSWTYLEMKAGRRGDA